jgi:tetratricopeptide (TPR) repeat protein
MGMIQEPEFVASVKAAVDSGEYDKAFDLYEQVLANDHESKQNHRRIEYAFLLWDCYEYGRAEAVFTKLLNDPKITLDIIQGIAKAYFKIGRFSDAAEAMRVAGSICPDNPEVFSQLASCLERSNQISPALEAAHQAVRLNPAYRPAIRLLARIDRRNGHYETAIKRLNRHLHDFPKGETWLLRYELAANLDRVGQFDQAWQELLTAKFELLDQGRQDLAASYAIRRRQADMAKAITDEDLVRWHSQPVKNAQPIALLAGFPRSGTTLIESVLTSHPKLLGTDETGILSSQFIRPIVWEAGNVADSLLEIRSFDVDQITAGRDTYFKLTSAVIGAEIGQRLLIEKDPLLTCDLALPLRLFPEARLIMPLRDPRDTVLSYFFTMLPRTWNSAPAIDIVESARFYHDVMRHWLLFRNRLPWPTLEFHYEDLVKEPVNETRRLCQFLQVDFQESMLDPQLRSSQKWITTPTYDEISKPIHSRALSRWKNYHRQMEPALKILDSWAKEFGYE